jgi:hypothetical protein
MYLSLPPLIGAVTRVLVSRSPQAAHRSGRIPTTALLGPRAATDNLTRRARMGGAPPFPAERMRAYSVSAKVNSVKNDEPSLIEAAQSAD